jgi:hypothetical protein
MIITTKTKAELIRSLMKIAYKEWDEKLLAGFNQKALEESQSAKAAYFWLNGQLADAYMELEQEVKQPTTRAEMIEVLERAKYK